MTLNSVESLYPSKVDSWVFAQDLSNDKVSIYNDFLAQTSKGQFTSAQNYAFENNMDILDAKLLLSMQYRIKSLQSIIENKVKPTHNCFNLDPIGLHEVKTYSNGNLVDLSYEKITPDIADNTVWVSSYTTSKPLLTQSYDTMVLSDQDDAIGYEE